MDARRLERRVLGQCDRRLPDAADVGAGVRAASRAQTVFGVPGRFIVYDVARDGRWLAVREDLSFGIRAKVPSQSTERDLSWLGSSGAKGMSADGEWLLLVDVGPRGGKNYGVVLRKTDASQALRLGEGNAQTLSPDGKWASAIIATPPQLVVYPTGTGATIRLNPGPIEHYESAELVSGRQTAARLRLRCHACAALLRAGPRGLAAASADARGCPGHPRARWPDAAALHGRMVRFSCRRSMAAPVQPVGGLRADGQADRVEPRQPIGVRPAQIARYRQPSNASIWRQGRGHSFVS